MRRPREQRRDALDAEADVAQRGAPAAAERVAAAVEDGAEGVDERPRRHGRRGDAHAGLEGARLGSGEHRRRAHRLAGERAAGIAQGAAQTPQRRIEGARLHLCDLLEIEQQRAQPAAGQRGGRRRRAATAPGRAARAAPAPRGCAAPRRPPAAACRRRPRAWRVRASHVGVARLVVHQHPRPAVLEPALEKAHHGFVLIRMPGDDGDDQVGDGEQRLARHPVVLQDAVEVGRVDEHQHGRQVRLLGDQQLGRIGGRLQRRVGGGVGAEQPQPEARQRRLGAQLGEQDRMRGADQPPGRAAGGHRRAQRPADQGVEQRRLAGIVGPDDAGHQVGVAARRCAAAGRARAGRAPTPRRASARGPMSARRACAAAPWRGHQSRQAQSSPRRKPQMTTDEHRCGTGRIGVYLRSSVGYLSSL